MRAGIVVVLRLHLFRIIIDALLLKLVVKAWRARARSKINCRLSSFLFEARAVTSFIKGFFFSPRSPRDRVFIGAIDAARSFLCALVKLSNN